MVCWFETSRSVRIIWPTGGELPAFNFVFSGVPTICQQALLRNLGFLNPYTSLGGVFVG